MSLGVGRGKRLVLGGGAVAEGGADHAVRKEGSAKPGRALGQRKAFGICSCFSARPWVDVKLESVGKWVRTSDGSLWLPCG